MYVALDQLKKTRLLCGLRHPQTMAPHETKHQKSANEVEQLPHGNPLAF